MEENQSQDKSSNVEECSSDTEVHLENRDRIQGNFPNSEQKPLTDGISYSQSSFWS